MKKYTLLLSLVLVTFSWAWAQSERIGQAGGVQLLINSMPRSSAFNGIDLGSVEGIEAAQVNPAGIGRTTGTELVFANTWWLIGSDIRVNSFGISQNLGDERGVLGLSVNAFNMGDFVRTTVDQPDGTLGTFSPTILNLGISFAKKFTDNIYVGFTTRVLNEATPEVSAAGVAFDAGIQYRTGEKDRVKLGISLRNVGPTMSFGGDGLTGRVPFQTTNAFTTAVELPTARFELPATLSMGGSVDFFLGSSNTVTLLGGFISNSFYLNQGGVGLAYKYKNYVILRGSFLYENGIFETNLTPGGRQNAYTGYAAGASFQIPIKSGKLDASGYEDFSKFSLDVSYRTTNPFDGTFVVGARIDL